MLLFFNISPNVLSPIRLLHTFYADAPHPLHPTHRGVVIIRAGLINLVHAELGKLQDHTSLPVHRREHKLKVRDDRREEA